jgi:hypothetical protein
MDRRKEALHGRAETRDTHTHARAQTRTHASSELRGDSLEPQLLERCEALQAGGERRRAVVADLVPTVARRGHSGRRRGRERGHTHTHACGGGGRALKYIHTSS